MRRTASLPMRGSRVFSAISPYAFSSVMPSSHRFFCTSTAIAMRSLKGRPGFPSFGGSRKISAVASTGFGLTNIAWPISSMNSRSWKCRFGRPASSAIFSRMACRRLSSSGGNSHLRECTKRYNNAHRRRAASASLSGLGLGLTEVMTLESILASKRKALSSDCASLRLPRLLALFLSSKPRRDRQPSALSQTDPRPAFLRPT